MARVTALDDHADRDAPPGSKPHAIYFDRLAVSFRDRLNADARNLRDVLDELHRSEAWKVLGSMSWEFYCAERLRLDAAALDAIAKSKDGETVGMALKAAERVRAAPKLASHGGAREQVDNINLNKGGTSADYLAARLKRDHPDIAEAVERGEYRSIRAAAKAAGIVRDPTPFEKARKALAKLDEAELRAIAAIASEMAEKVTT